MTDQGRYTTLAPYYDRLYAWKDYTEDARRIVKLVRRFGPPRARKLLDVGCGTGSHLLHLQRRFNCQGVEKSRPMLAVARRKLPKVPLHFGDMEGLRLNEQFDVVTCLFAAIAYVKTLARLQRTLRNFARVLRPGGLLIVDPWLTPEKNEVGRPSLTIYDGRDAKIARVGVAELRHGRSYFRFEILVAERNRKVRRFVEIHDLGLFSVPDFLRAMRGAGFSGRYLSRGLMPDRGLYVGVRQGTPNGYRRPTN